MAPDSIVVCRAMTDNNAPICTCCRVTALPGAAAGIPAAFVCDNPDCESFGEPWRC